MKKPPYIRKDDTIGIIAPAGIVDPKDIEPAIDILREWGLNVAKGKYLYHKHNFFAGSDKQRLEDFQAMLDDRSIKAIFCARGGYGLIRILNELDFTHFRKNPKWIVGYSDITLIHSFLSKKLKIQSLHAIMPKNFIRALEDNQSLDFLKKALFGEPLSYEIPFQKLSREGNAKGMLTGGNLSILCSLQATPYEIETKNKILFIEDVNEYLYRLDRMMINMKMSNKLSGLKGLIIGGMTDMKNTAPDYGKNAYEIVYEMVKEYNYPVLFGFPAGHMYPNLPLIMGNEVEMNVKQETCSIKFLP